MYNPVKPYKKKILELIQKTQNTPYLVMERGLIWKKFVYPEFHHVDGIGTKGVYHWQKRTFKNAVLDALAMNLNDLLCVRATPYALTDHILVPQDDEEAILEIVDSLARECQKRYIAITGGETSIHNNLNGLEISISMDGFIYDIRPNQFQVGDILVGIASNGFHTNGFTKVRKIFGKEFHQEFVEPTAIYWDTIFPLLEHYAIHGMAHITGGAFTKIKDLLVGCDALITSNHILAPQPIFQELYDRGISDKEMYKTFNCGIGFVLGVPEKDCKKIMDEIHAFDFACDIVGKIAAGKGKVKVESMFSSQEILF